MRREADGALLAEQLGLLEEKKREVPELLRRGDRPGQDIADELAGIRMVILAALLHFGGSEAERDELRLREREARALLREVMLPPLEGGGPSGAGDHLLAGELVVAS